MRWILAIISSGIAAGSAVADIVTLFDGSTREGTIVYDHADYLVLRARGSDQREAIPRSRIRKIDYGTWTDPRGGSTRGAPPSRHPVIPGGPRTAGTDPLLQAPEFKAILFRDGRYIEGRVLHDDPLTLQTGVILDSRITIAPENARSILKLRPPRISDHPLGDASVACHIANCQFVEEQHAVVCSGDLVVDARWHQPPLQRFQRPDYWHLWPGEGASSETVVARDQPLPSSWTLAFSFTVPIVSDEADGLRNGTVSPLDSGSIVSKIDARLVALLEQTFVVVAAHDHAEQPVAVICGLQADRMATEGFSLVEVNERQLAANRHDALQDLQNETDRLAEVARQEAVAVRAEQERFRAEGQRRVDEERLAADARRKFEERRRWLNGIEQLLQSRDIRATHADALGSGFFVSADGYFATNAHVVRGSSRLVVHSASRTYWAEIIQVDDSNDLAILKVHSLTGDVVVPSLAIRGSSGLRLADRVFTVGYPDPLYQGVEPKYAAGDIAALTGFQDDPTLLQISVPVQPGNSGGPLVDASGGVVGVIVAKLVSVDRSGPLPENVNYAVKGSLLVSLFESIPGLKAQLPSTTARPLADLNAVVEQVKQSTGLVLVFK